MPHTYAVALGALGYTVLTFDFAGFGQSGGEPRQLELPARKILDIIAAADFLATMSFVGGGEAGHVGICTSAQYALAAIARGARIRSFASVAGWYHDTQSVAGFYGEASGVAQRLERAGRAIDTFSKDRTVVTVPAYRVGDDRAGMWFELDYYGNRQRAAVPSWMNEMAEMSWAYWLTFDGLRSASVPTLMVHGDGCMLPDNARAVHAALAGPKQLEWAQGSQIDFYDQPAQVNSAVALIDEHFKRTLGASAR